MNDIDRGMFPKSAPPERAGRIAEKLLKDMASTEYHIGRRAILNLARILREVVQDRYKLAKLESIALELAKLKATFFVKRQFTKCSKKCNKCPHGPYYYIYYRVEGVQKSKYLGKPL